MELTELLAAALDMGGADIFIVPGAQPAVKCMGVLKPLQEARLMPADAEALVRQAYKIAADRNFDLLRDDGDDDFSFSLERRARFRCNAYRQRGTYAATMRAVAFGLPDPTTLHIPQLVIDLAERRSGLILVTGPAGSGKSTTLACMIDRINSTRMGHIITIEDPIEYLHPHKQSVISQREVPNDAGSFARAARRASSGAGCDYGGRDARHGNHLHCRYGSRNGPFGAFIPAYGGSGQNHGSNYRYLPIGSAAADARAAFHCASGRCKPTPCAHKERRPGPGF